MPFLLSKADETKAGEKMKLEIIKDFDNTYCCNLKGINEYISLKQLKEEIKKQYGIIVKGLKTLEMIKHGRKTYFYQEINLSEANIVGF